MFDTDELVADLISCLAESDPRRAVRQTLDRAVASPAEMVSALPPEAAGIDLLYRSDELTVLTAVWAPGMSIFPHDHRMWACIGVYAGREDNAFFRRPADGVPGLVPSGDKRLDVGDVTLLGADTVHAVHNPLDQVTAAVHVYGGDFITQDRSQWLEPAMVEEPYDLTLANQVFADANAEWKSPTSAGNRTGACHRRSG